MTESKITKEIKKFAMKNEFSNIANAYFTNNTDEFKKLAFEFFLTDNIKIDNYNRTIVSELFEKTNHCILYLNQYILNIIEISKQFESYCNLIKAFLINKMSNISFDW